MGDSKGVPRTDATLLLMLLRNVSLGKKGKIVERTKGYCGTIILTDTR